MSSVNTLQHVDVVEASECVAHRAHSAILFFSFTVVPRFNQSASCRVFKRRVQIITNLFQPHLSLDKTESDSQRLIFYDEMIMKTIWDDDNNNNLNVLHFQNQTSFKSE